VLFEPFQIATMQLRNRLVMSPMETCYADPEGLPSEQYVAYLEARARGGVGLITLGASTIDARHREVPNSIHFASDRVLAPHRELVERVHAHGAKIQPQLVHPGPDGLGPFLSGTDSVGPSVIPSYLLGNPCRELRVEEIPAILDLYKAAVRRTREAGYDGIELHAAHGYMLLGSFLTPWRNKRSDAYRGDTLEGRARLVIEVLEAVRAEVGADFPITLRISGYERTAGGRALDDTQQLAPLFVQAGVDAFHVSGGVIDRLTTQMVTGSRFGAAHNVAAAAAVKRAVDVPVMTVGRIHDVADAERILRDGFADLIVMGRPLLADAELPKKAREGRTSEIRRCISCETCIDSMETMRMRCAVNAFTGREAELSTRRAAKPKLVVVIGAGPGGLEATRIAALRGHRVRLYERRRHLGGALVMAATVHAENRPFLDYLLQAVRRPEVTVELGRPVDCELVAHLEPDAVIVATGGRLVTPRIPGDDLPHVVSGSTLRAMLTGEPGGEPARAPVARLAATLLRGPAQRLVHPRVLRPLTRVWMPLGRRVVVIGGDLAAVELAEFLAERGRSVSILDRGSQIAPEVGAKRRAEHMESLDRLGVVVNTAATVVAIRETGVELARTAATSCLVPADSVIIAGEVTADTTLYDALRERLGDRAAVHAVGDCTGLGLIRKAVEQAARAACSV
jgi:2,4-dienoyl-CoA reductase (NADPH2)